MKKKKKTYIRFVLAAAAVYFALLLVLLISEHVYGGSEIDSLGMAVWYSIVTLSTVGYGDIVPVSPLGRAIGVIFLLLSMGVLATVFGTVMSFLTGEALPLVRLSFKKDKNWYYFADYGEEAGILARNILKEDENGVIIFGERKADQSELPDYPCLFIDVSPATIVARKKGVGERCKAFFMKENDISFNTRAQNLHRLPVNVYARTTSGIDNLSGNIRFFHSYDCCARQFWQMHPVRFAENNIIIIGFGNYGKAILERAILTNVWSDSQHIAYHIFGDAEEFLKLHYRLDQVFSVNEIAEDRDSLVFHRESWTSHYELLETADRIIICEDDVQKGWDIYWKLQNYYRLRGKIYLRSNRKLPGVAYFGTHDEIYTPEQILRTQLNNAAITINELFRKSVSYPTVGWEELDNFHRQSKIAAADHLLMKARVLMNNEKIYDLTPFELSQAYRQYRMAIYQRALLEKYRKIEHLRWCRFYYYYNWSCGPVRNDQLRQHPMLRPYAELTDVQKIERDQAWQLLNNISSWIG